MMRRREAPSRMLRPSPAASGAARRVAMLAVILAAVSAQTGCAVIAGAGAAGALAGGAVGALAAGGEPPASSAVGSAVSIDIEPARDLVLVGATPGDTATLRNVRYVLGRVTAVRADTLWLAVTEARRSSGPETYAAIGGPVTAVVTGPGVAVRVIARRADRATSAYIGAAFGAVAAIVGLYLWCAQTRCLD